MNQHLVSRSLLRQFTNTKGGKIGCFNVRTLESSEGGVDVLGSIRDLVIKDAEKYERKWEQTERKIGYAVKLVENGSIFKNPKFLSAIRDFIALHFARSFSLVQLYSSLYPATRQKFIDSVLAKASPQQVLQDLAGQTTVSPGAARKMASAVLSRHFDQEAQNGGMLGKMLLEYFERGKNLVARHELEFWHTKDDEFLLSDAPVVTFDKENDKIGAHNGVAWNDADVIFMPLGPNFAVALSKKAGYFDASARMVEAMNVYQVRGALREVYFRIGSGLDDILTDAFKPSAD